MGVRAVIGGLLVVAAIVAIAVPGGATGDDASKPYPTRQVQIMAPAAPGGGWDTTARAFQAASRDGKLDDGTEVYNVEGAGGTLGVYSLLVTALAAFVLPNLPALTGWRREHASGSEED